MKPRVGQTQPHSQGGAIMVIALILLVVLTMLGLASSNVTRLEERMAGNTRDHDLALQAAEAGLKDAEKRLTDSAYRALATTLVATNANDAAYWNAYDWDNASIEVSQTVNQVAAQPRVVLERRGANNYRATARGIGATINSVVILQAEFVYTP